ncbi:MAG: endonuclease, partial [Cryobacterium sp.]|nr:endonuclease [Cryobacterium sp.]
MRTLVLNAGYEPLAVVSFKRALVLVMNQKATIVESDRGHPVVAASGSWERPSVILLTRYVKIPRSSPAPVSRRGVLRRDDHRCCYCGKSASTIDHVLPRSRGGRDTWDNLVACCLRCNNVKGDQTPSELGWGMMFKPRVPQGSTWVVR